MDVLSEIFKLKDDVYAKFLAKLIPNIDDKTIIGVKTPKLKQLSKRLDLESINNFTQTLPHKFLEENNLHAYIISLSKNYENTLKALDEFLPYIDNWATCDGLRPNIVKNNKKHFLTKINIWIKSNHVYTVRFAIEMLMTYYLDDDFNEDYLSLVASVKSDEYYVNMMIAWYFATALAKQYDATIRYLENKKLSVWVHNKTIQKSIESFRITDDNKEYLRTLKIKR